MIIYGPRFFIYGPPVAASVIYARGEGKSIYSTEGTYNEKSRSINDHNAQDKTVLLLYYNSSFLIVILRNTLNSIIQHIDLLLISSNLVMALEKLLQYQNSFI